MRWFLILFCLYCSTGLAQADSAAEFAAAKATFEAVQAELNVGVNQLDSELRTAIWTQYYLALERLEQMDVHQQMMSRHKMDRAAQFNQARAEFDRALDKLYRLLPENP